MPSSAIVPTNQQGHAGERRCLVVPGDGAIAGAVRRRAATAATPKQQQGRLHRPVRLRPASGRGRRARRSRSFTLIAALKKGISLSSTFDGPPTVDVNGTPIHNSSPGETCYGCTLLKAFAESINTIFVPLAKQVGPQKVVDAAYDAGIPKSRELHRRPDIALGPDQVSPLDLANAYATIAAQGMHAAPYLVKSVTTVDGQRDLPRDAAPDAGVRRGRHG